MKIDLSELTSNGMTSVFYRLTYINIKSFWTFIIHYSTNIALIKVEDFRKPGMLFAYHPLLSKPHKLLSTKQTQKPLYTQIVEVDVLQILHIQS